MPPARRGPSAAAQAAAQRTRRERFEARLRERADGVRPDRAEVFVVRDPADPHGFLFELRRFGGIVAYRGATRFATPGAARAAGEAVLARAGDALG